MSHPTAPHLDAQSASLPASSLWSKSPIIGALIGLLGLGGMFATGSFHGEGLFAYLVAYLFFFSLAMGALFFVVIQHATRAGWSVVIRRLAEILSMGFPVLLVLFAPIALGAHDLYHWTHLDVVAKDPILTAKSGYLNMGFWLGRAVFYLVASSAYAWFFYSKSVKQDADGDLAYSHATRGASYPALPVLALSVTFAAFDWSMSLDPHWFSTMFGICFFAGGMISLLATLAIMGHSLKTTGPLAVVTTEHFHDIGKLLFGFTVFWSYVNFSQFMLIWYANIPEETKWFAHRWIEFGWDKFSIFLAIGHFALPFFFLMTRHTKRNKVTLLIASFWMLAMHYLDLFWQVMPTEQHHGPHFSAAHGLSMLMIGGFFFALVGVFLKKSSLVPVKDPRLSESLRFTNF
jgi:hypothetical protein